jgi:hypothetical protein
MPELPSAQSKLEPPYRVEVGGKMEHMSVPSYARAISLAESYVSRGSRRKVEIFDSHRRQVYVSKSSTPA